MAVCLIVCDLETSTMRRPKREFDIKSNIKDKNTDWSYVLQDMI
jgi:hypothetical protein